MVLGNYLVVNQFSPNCLHNTEFFLDRLLSIKWIALLVISGASTEAASSVLCRDNIEMYIQVTIILAGPTCSS